MITSDQAVEALRMANPAVDVRHLPDHTLAASVLLEDTARRMDMKTQHTTVTKLEPRGPRRRGWLIAAAIFAAVLAVGTVATVVVSLGDDPDVANTPSTTIQSAPENIPLSGVTDEAAVEAFTAVEAAYIAYNSGEAATWAVARSSGPGLPAEALAEEISLVTDISLAEHAAGAHIEITNCESHGFGDWPTEGGPDTGFRYSCHSTQTDAFHDPAGMVLAEITEWIVADGVIFAASGKDAGQVDGFDTWNRFMRRYLVWLEAEHTDVWAELELIDNLPFSIYPAAVSIPTALEYIDEFVASQN